VRVVSEAGPRSLPPIDVDLPDLARWAAGNAGIPFVWRFTAERPGPTVVVQALTHGNEVCGAIVLDRLLGSGFRPQRGTFVAVFANVDAYLAFDRAQPFASRCLDEDFNRLWSADVLDGPRRSRELARARALRPVIDAADYLLDLHSMTDACPPLALAGPRRKGLALARRLGTPAHVVVDGGHAAGRRLRDYAFFDDPEDERNALLVECGQHWERAAPDVAMLATVRFLALFGLADAAFVAERGADRALPPQRTIEVTHAITIGSDDFEFVRSARPLGVVPRAGTVLARDGATDILTPYDECVLVMPTRRPRRGETAVRLGRYLD
jgi:predicted deacylase